MKEKKNSRGANPRPMVLNASVPPLHHSDLLFLTPFPRHMTYDKSYHHREEIKYNRSGVVVGPGFAPRQPFLFFKRFINHIPVVTYNSYYRREEIKYNRSGWCSGRALTFKTLGRGFAPRQHFLFFTRKRRRRVSCISP